MPLNFTLLYSDKTNDVDDSSGDVGVTPAHGPLLFEPHFELGARIPYGVDTGLAPRVFPAYLDVDGQLKPERGGDVGIRLWANDPAFGLDRFEYQVSAPKGLSDGSNRRIPFKSFYFDAPNEDVVRYLKDEMPKPGQDFMRGRPGFGIATNGLDINSSGELVITREDGVELPPVFGVPESNALSAVYAMTFGR